MKYLITGASGPFGSGVAERLIAAGIAPADLILVSRRAEGLADMAARGAQVRTGSFDDEAPVLAKAFAGAERMLMISTSRVGEREPQHRAAVEAAKAAGVRHVIYTSFVGDDANVSMAVADHRFTEALLRESGMDWTILRNSQYSEAMRDAGAPGAIRSGHWESATGEGRIALVTREDCIAAAAAVIAGAGHEGRTYQITGPELLTYRDVAAIIAGISGVSIAYRDVDVEQRYAFFDAMGVPRRAVDDHVVDGYGWCSDDMVSFEASIANGSFAILSDDVERLTGRHPESLRDFLTRHRDALA